KARHHVAVHQKGERAAELHVEGKRIEVDQGVEIGMSLGSHASDKQYLRTLGIEVGSRAELQRVQCQRLISPEAYAWVVGAEVDRHPPQVWQIGRLRVARMQSPERDNMVDTCRPSGSHGDIAGHPPKQDVRILQRRIE